MVGYYANQINWAILFKVKLNFSRNKKVIILFKNLWSSMTFCNYRTTTRMSSFDGSHDSKCQVFPTSDLQFSPLSWHKKYWSLTIPSQWRYVYTLRKLSQADKIKCGLRLKLRTEVTSYNTLTFVLRLVGRTKMLR